MRDLSKIEGTITNKVENLICRMNNLQEYEIRQSFLDILDSESTSISSETMIKWKMSLSKKRNKLQIMQMITNLYLAGSNLSV